MTSNEGSDNPFDEFFKQILTQETVVPKEHLFFGKPYKAQDIKVAA